MKPRAARMPSGMDFLRRKSSTPHYQTFPTAPPKSRGRPPPYAADSGGQDGGGDPSQNGDMADQHHNSPLPTRQLAVLAVIALAEQTALNSISPYLPEMTSTFPEVDASQIGLYVGLIASSYALAQFATGFFWGWLSDQIGRKPVVMIGTVFTAMSFIAFGFCKSLWQAVIVQACMGLFNGNQGVISTCLGEITDRSNQSKAFVYLPVIYGIGGITGPALGGLLVMHQNPFNKALKNPYPYLLPNLFSASVLLIDLVVTGFFLEESLEEAKTLPPLKKRVGSLFTWMWQFMGGARNPTYIRNHRHASHRTGRALDNISEGETTDEESETQSLLSVPEMFAHSGHQLTKKEILNRDTLLLLGTYLIFQLSNISFNTLYPVFAQAPAPSGRELSPEEIGLSLSFAGMVTIVFQVGVFGKLKEKMGNKATYRAGLFLFFLSMIMMPFVQHKDDAPIFGLGSGKVWLWIEMGIVLLIKTVAAVGGLTSALLLITNSAPNHSVLGTLNGLAQTLSAAGRAAGPFLSGGLFSLSTHITPKGEALPWGLFGGIAFLGFLASWGIRSEDLESQEWDEEEGSDGNGEGEDEEESEEERR